jgi:predicted nucleic acid-binding protein
MLTYLFDASAAVELYARDNVRHKAKVRKAAEYIVDQRKLHRQATLYIPNFCVVEVFNTLARKHFRDGELDKEHYENSLTRFIDDVHWGKTLYSYELNRYHIIGADEIIPIEHSVASEHDRDHLSTFDVLVIAMASELAYVGEAESTFLVTCDRRIKRVVEQLKAGAGSREIWRHPGRPLDDPGIRRWVPPKCPLPARTQARGDTSGSWPGPTEPLATEGSRRSLLCG